MTYGIQTYIANLSMYMAQQSLASELSVRLLDKVMETAQTASETLVEDLLQTFSLPTPNAGEIGYLLDTYA
jgi:hypothetical protein